MKMLPSLLLLLSFSIASAAPEPGELVKLRHEWQKDLLASKRKLEKMYFEELEQIKNNFLTGGNLKAAIAVQNAIDQKVNDGNEPAEIIKLGTTYKNSANVNRKKITKRYYEDLQKLKKAYMNATDLENSIAVDNEIKKVADHYKNPVTWRPRRNRTSKGADNFSITEKPAVNLDDPEQLQQVINNATKQTELNKRTESGINILYDPVSNALYTGWVKEHRPNGKLKHLGQYKNGRTDGIFALWNEEGRKSIVLNFKDGKQHGMETVWHKNGSKRLEFDYSNGKKHGATTTWREDGSRQSTVNYQHGIKHGMATYWHLDGSKQREESYSNGKLDGKYTSWREDGTVEREINYKNGQKHGLETSYYPSGQKRQEIVWKMGAETDAKSWRENGIAYTSVTITKTIDGNSVTKSFQHREKLTSNQAGQSLILNGSTLKFSQSPDDVGKTVAGNIIAPVYVDMNDSGEWIALSPKAGLFCVGKETATKNPVPYKGPFVGGAVKMNKNGEWILAANRTIWIGKGMEHADRELQLNKSIVSAEAQLSEVGNWKVRITPELGPKIEKRGRMPRRW
jgi:antitoxin component YwqK of YwqJK toxin-antitoxin module